jgi:uncharacterized membrane protein YhaH (DUF805 family)
MSFTQVLFSFEGRIGRGTFWAVSISYVVVGIVLNVVVGPGGSEVLLGLFGLLFIPVMWIFSATHAKRWHDLDKSGWMALTLLIPLANLLIHLFLGLASGTSGANKYGKAPGNSESNSESM